MVEGKLGTIIGTIAYPSLRYGGKLTLLGVDVDNNSIQLSEDITYGTDRCVDGGTVTLTYLDNETLDYSWQGNDPTPDSGSLERISETIPNCEEIVDGICVISDPDGKFYIAVADLDNSNIQVDVISNTVTAHPTHFSKWTILTDPIYHTYLPLIIK